MTVLEFISKYKWVLVILLLLLAFFGGRTYEHHKIYSEFVPQVDTVTKIVSVYKDFPDPVSSITVGFISIPRYAFLTDTVTNEHYIPVHDTTTQYVYLPREQKYYEEEEGSLRMWVSGYEPRLDRYELDKKEVYITNTVVVPPPKFILGIGAGFGAMFPEKTVNYVPSIELDARYSITQRWDIGLMGGYEAPITGGKITPSPFVKIYGRFNILSF